MADSKWIWAILAAAVVAAFIYNRSELSQSEDTIVPKIAFIVGGPDPFWQEVIAGAKQSEKENGADITYFVPDEGGKDQTRHLLSVKAADYDGVAISPLAPETQGKAISVLAAQTTVVTYDNDAPQSLRHCYVGTNNLLAGRDCGKLVQSALPEGGKIALFVGDVERDNARLRRNSLINALREKPIGTSIEETALDQPIEAGKFAIVATYLDGSVSSKAKENAAQALSDHAELDAMVGLYGYNGPMCLEALTEANKLGEVKIIAFDAHDATLQGIEAGNIYGTVVQDPYQYGYEAVRVLVGLANRKDSALPFVGSGTFYFPCQPLTQENLAQYKNKVSQRGTATESNPKEEPTAKAQPAEKETAQPAEAAAS